VVDNGSSDENKKKMEELRREYGFTYLYEPMPFNFSKMCNLGVEQAKGDLILLLNDDMEIIEESWLERMAGQALQPHVGAVGAKLWYAGTETIQHVGITNLKIGPSHKLITFSDDRDYYYGRNRVTYDVIGVTGACLMVTRRKYLEVGGLDEEMAVAYNDVDFCFKLLEAGYFNVQRNDVVLYHHESLSRGLDEDDSDKWDRLLQEKTALYAKHPAMDGVDPFYHKDLVDNASDYRCNYKFPYEEHLLTVEVSGAEPSLLRKAKEGRLQLTVDRAECQHKIHQDEEDILWIMGWSYMPRADNAAYERLLLLQKEDGTIVTAQPHLWHREDVEAILPDECNVGLSGFVVRIRKANLPVGTWKIGMLCQGAAKETQGCRWLTWSDRSVTI
jgi:glycosyltransferase involved in cell wall biosynthesis